MNTLGMESAVGNTNGHGHDTTGISDTPRTDAAHRIGDLKDESEKLERELAAVTREMDAAIRQIGDNARDAEQVQARLRAELKEAVGLLADTTAYLVAANRKIGEALGLANEARTEAIDKAEAFLDKHTNDSNKDGQK